MNEVFIGSDMLKDNLIELEKFPGFYKIPHKPEYAISKNGDLIRIKDGRKLLWTTHKAKCGKNIKGGYKTNRLGSRHRLLALTFLKQPDGCLDIANLTVNHLNGIPGDDRLENLEWCTYSQNTKHAYDLGLYPNKTVSVLVKDFRADQILTFNTIQAAGEYTKLPPGTIATRLKRNPGSRYNDFAIKINDGKDWPFSYLRENTHDHPVVVKNILDEKVYLFDSQDTAAIFIKGTQSNISKTLLSKTFGYWNGFLYTDFRKDIIWPVFDKIDIFILENNTDKAKYGLVAEDVTTGEKEYFYSWKHAVERFSKSKNSLYAIFKRKHLIDDRFKLSLISPLHKLS